MMTRMSPEDFNKAVDIATAYFVLSGVEKEHVQAIGQHVRDLFREGENRPLMLANRAIDRMLHQLEVEWEIDTAQLNVVFHSA
jgi:hypothetical protein